MAYRLILTVFLLCAALIGAVRGLASHQPPSETAALLPDSTCPAPCWQGMRPGYITPDEIKQQLARSRWTGAAVSVDGGTAGTVEEWTAVLGDDARLYFAYSVQSPALNELRILPTRLRIGDVIGALGEPDVVTFAYYYPHGSVRSRVELEYRLHYRQPVLIVSGTLPLDELELVPEQEVEVLSYRAVPWTLPLLSFEWRGFGSIVRHYYPGGVAP